MWSIALSTSWVSPVDDFKCCCVNSVIISIREPWFITLYIFGDDGAFVSWESESSGWLMDSEAWLASFVEISVLMEGSSWWASEESLVSLEKWNHSQNTQYTAILIVDWFYDEKSCLFSARRSYVLLVGGKDISRVLYSKKNEEDTQNRIVYEPVKNRKYTVSFWKCKEGEFYCFLIGPLNSVHSKFETQLSSFFFSFLLYYWIRNKTSYEKDDNILQ